MYDWLGGEPSDTAEEIPRYEFQHNWVHNSKDKGEESPEDNERVVKPAQLTGKKCDNNDIY